MSSKDASRGSVKLVFRPRGHALSTKTSKGMPLFSPFILLRRNTIIHYSRLPSESVDSISAKAQGHHLRSALWTRFLSWQSAHPVGDAFSSIGRYRAGTRFFLINNGLLNQEQNELERNQLSFIYEERSAIRSTPRSIELKDQPRQKQSRTI